MSTPSSSLDRMETCWLETSPWGNVDQNIKTRQHVYANVGAFNAWTDSYNTLSSWTVFVKDTDHALWQVEQSPWRSVAQIDGSVM